MNSRSRIQRVILLNWKGMFFQPFDLDEGMTILEGANGTGKTTIMIAVYTCLMPDLNFLNFQNVTTVATRKNEDKGLYGRLGDGDAVYALLDIVTASGERHLVGVQLIRRTYPQVSLRHFAIRKLDPDTDLTPVLLRELPETRQQEIPDLDEIGRRAAESGGELIRFRHAREYFRFLFDAGITPIRLLDNEERKQYNQLLHTSLYGGLSRSLQSSLRDYLLPQDNTLVSGIREMEQNLLACRRTRATIRRYQSVRDVIRGVYQNGLEMFSAAFCAHRLEAGLVIEKALEARRDRRAVRRQWEQTSAELTALNRQLQSEEAALKALIPELSTAREQLDRCRQVDQIDQELGDREKERRRQRDSEQSARERVADLDQQVKALQTKFQSLTDEQLELARKLANAGQAWEGLSRQVGLYRQARTLLEETRRLLNNDELTETDIETWRQRIETAEREQRQRHQDAYQRWQEAGLRQQHYERYHRLLTELTDAPADPETAGAAARRVIDKHRVLAERRQAAADLSVRLETIDHQLDRKRRLLEILSRADLRRIDSGADFNATWQSTQDAIREQETALRTLQQQLQSLQTERQTLNDRLPELQNRLGQWEVFQETRRKLEDHTARPITSRRELSDLRDHLRNRRQETVLSRYQLEAKLKSRQHDHHNLIQTGIADRRLHALQAEGYGKLLAGRYEEIPAEWSANLESRLGPLVNALVVKDVQAAAEELTRCLERPDTIWLVPETTGEKLPDARELPDGLLVQHGDAWRLTRLSAQPELGKKARGQKIEALSRHIQRLNQELEKNFQTLQGIDADQEMLNRLIPFDHLLEATSPKDELTEIHQRQPTIHTETKTLTGREEHAARRLAALRNQVETLQAHFPDRELLDEKDLEKTRQALVDEQTALAENDAVFLQRDPIVQQLKPGIDILDTPPDTDLEALAAAVKVARQEEERLRAALEALRRLEDCREHFGYADQEPLLAEKQNLTEHLNQRLEAVEKAQADLHRPMQTLTEQLSAAAARARTEEDQRLSLDGQIKQLRDSRQRLIDAGSVLSTAEAEQALAGLSTRQAEQEQTLNQLKADHYRLEAELNRLQEEKTRADGRRQKLRDQSPPLLKTWRRFRRQARQDGLLERLMTMFYSEASGQRKAERYWRNEAAARATLIKTLESLPNTGRLLEQIRALQISSESPGGDDCHAIWQQVRGYLNQVIPVDLQTSDPERAQENIADKLSSLEQHLAEQEQHLRRHVQNIPAHINARIRKEKSRLRQLNQNLEKIGFGFIETIRLHLETQPKLKEFLDVLPQQLDIFAEISRETVPIEILMAKLYEDIGAGKVKGDLLLDYRHYVRLNIEVRREGNPEFEKVTATNLSTGESIGVGIAVLIMVLMSWEDQTQAIRPTTTPGNLRFLMLDESSRLDQKALHTLNDICGTMDLQLLIAAPLVERTLRGTTHHLTRATYQGQETVVVRGRRLTGSSTPA
jgi:chromosome partition protein MukB